MNLFELLRIAYQALKSNKLRASLTMLGVIIGVGSVILLVSIGSGLKTYVTEQLEGLGTDSLFVIPGEFSIGSGEEKASIPGAGAAASKFTFDHLNDLERKGQTIKMVMPYTENNASLRHRGNTHITQVAGVGANYQEIRDQEVVSGSFFNPSHYNAAKRVAVLGRTVVKELFTFEDPLGKKIFISDRPYIVLGVLKEKGSFGRIDVDDQVFIPATTAMRQFDMEHIQCLWVKCQSSKMIEECKQEVERILSKTLDEDQFSILDTKSILDVVSNILGVLTLALAGIAAISLIVGGIGIMNIMLVSVSERTREVGLRKAVGATPKAILVQFLIEAVILSFTGGTIGILLGVGGSLIVNRFFTTTITFWSIILAFGVSALVGIIFGVAPAYKAARLDPIDALRYE